MNRSKMTRLLPRFVRALPTDSIGPLIQRAASRGDKSTAVRTARTLVAAVPRSGKAQRHLVRALLAAPVTAADVAEAEAAANIMLALYEDASVRTLFVDVQIAKHVIHPQDRAVDDAVAAFIAARPESRAPAARRFLVHLVSAGEADRAREFSLEVARFVDLVVYWTVAHEFALRAGRVDEAEAIEELIRVEHADSMELDAVLRAARLAHEHRPLEVLDTLDALRPTRSAQFSRLTIGALIDSGRHADVLAYLDDVNHSLPEAEELLVRFDALFAVGRLEEAAELLDDESVSLTDLEVFRRRRDVRREMSDDADQELYDELRAIEGATGGISADIDTLVRLYFELDRLDDVERLMTGHTTRWQVDVLARYTWATTLYCRRRFDEALVELDGLAGTIRHWEADKLRSRISFELGDDQDALDLRRRSRRHDGELDEVEYHATLHHDRPQAMRSYLSLNDRKRAASVFGDLADVDGNLGEVGTRAVIMQGGPGDEIQLASTYATLEAMSDRLVITCEPRLAGIMRRSFPAIDFVLVERMRSRRHCGFLEPQAAARAPNALFDLVTADAMESLAAADSIVLARSLQIASGLREGPSPAYLRPPDTPADQGSREHPVVGVAWRSEFGSAMRSIHYLTVPRLEPVLRSGHHIVCLQHDVTDEERDDLHRLTNGRVEFPECDLRDDFEATADLLSGLDAVVGVGTTMIELSAALGVQTFIAQPTRFGTWRAIDDEGQDYWHRSARIVGAPEPHRLDELGRLLAAGVDSWLTAR